MEKLSWKEIEQQVMTRLIPAADGSTKFKFECKEKDLALNSNIFKSFLFERDHGSLND